MLGPGSSVRQCIGVLITVSPQCTKDPACAANWPFWAWIIIGIGGLVLIVTAISTIIACCCRSRPEPMAVPVHPHPKHHHGHGHYGKGGQDRGGYPIGAFAGHAGRQPPRGYPGAMQQPAAPNAYPPSIGYPQPQYPTGYSSSPMGPPPPGNFRMAPGTPAAAAAAAGARQGQQLPARQGSPRGKKGTPRGGRDALATI